ncbi:hypothetical protein QE152_g3987 [Popillia japonica]|uniref:Uncharacterized protein n=1 Tax=Popillia japonica TaxID=7064 RepID=A0AAW1N2D4_POPJA
MWTEILPLIALPFHGFDIGQLSVALPEILTEILPLIALPFHGFDIGQLSVALPEILLRYWHSKKNELSLFEFKSQIAECLLKEGKSTDRRKLNRPRSSSNDNEQTLKKTEGYATKPLPKKICARMVSFIGQLYKRNGNDVRNLAVTRVQCFIAQNVQSVYK